MPRKSDSLRLSKHYYTDIEIMFMLNTISDPVNPDLAEIHEMREALYIWNNCTTTITLPCDEDEKGMVIIMLYDRVTVRRIVDSIEAYRRIKNAVLN